MELQTFRSRDCSQGQVSFIRNHSVGCWRRAFNAASIEKFLSLLEKVVPRPNSLFTCNRTNFAASLIDPPSRRNANSFFFFSFSFFNPSSRFHFLPPFLSYYRPGESFYFEAFSFSSLFQLFMKARLITSSDVIVEKKFLQEFVKIHGTIFEFNGF